MKFLFLKDYKTEDKIIKSETICDVIEYEVLKDKEWLFDVDSPLAKEYGKIV